MNSPSLETAKDVIEAAEAKATDIEQPMVITITTDEGTLIAQHRMDGAWLASVEISRNKAYTAAALETSTDALATTTQPGESLYGLQTTDQNRIVVFGGGYPLIVDEEIIGAIGVSGGEVEQDMEVAKAGVETFDDLQH